MTTPTTNSEHPTPFQPSPTRPAALADLITRHSEYDFVPLLELVTCQSPDGYEAFFNHVAELVCRHLHDGRGTTGTWCASSTNCFASATPSGACGAPPVGNSSMGDGTRVRWVGAVLSRLGHLTSAVRHVREIPMPLRDLIAQVYKDGDPR